MNSGIDSLGAFLRAALRRIYPFEVYTGGIVALSVAFLLWRGLPQNAQTAAYTLLPMLKELPKALLLGLGLHLLFRLLQVRRRPVERAREYVRAVVSWSWIVLWARLWLAAMLMTYAYFWLKVFVPLINARIWDGWLAAADEVLHLGLSPTVFMVELLKGTPLVGFLDFWYSLWVMSVTTTMAFFTAHTEPLLRRRFMLSCCLIWTLGAWLYVAMPALGPIYVEPGSWQEVRGSLPEAEAAQLGLWQNYQKVLASRAGPLQNFNPTRGIAAMPSLHVGVHFLFMLWAWRGARPLFLFFAVGTGLTFLGSLLTGWHYAVDAYVGIALAWLSFKLATWWERPRGEDAAP